MGWILVNCPPLSHPAALWHQATTSANRKRQSWAWTEPLWRWIVCWRWMHAFRGAGFQRGKLALTDFPIGNPLVQPIPDRLSVSANPLMGAISEPHLQRNDQEHNFSSWWLLCSCVLTCSTYDITYDARCAVAGHGLGQMALWAKWGTLAGLFELMGLGVPYVWSEGPGNQVIGKTHCHSPRLADVRKRRHYRSGYADNLSWYVESSLTFPDIN